MNSSMDHGSIAEVLRNFMVTATNWSSSSPVCSWIGISCSSRHHRVAALDISNNPLRGELPEELAHLQRVKLVNVTGNRFSGTLPSDLGRRLPNQEKFSCSSNLLSCFISSSISNSSRLTGLDISWNSFTDPIPESLALSFFTSLTNCRELRVLKFDRNPLDGVFSASVRNFSATQIFEEQGCKLKGVIPEEIGNLTTMTMMSLQNNELAGHIPNTIQRMLNLQELYLQSNKIEGPIPDIICNLKNLGALDLSGNHFSGSVPPCLGSVTSLSYVARTLQNVAWGNSSRDWKFKAAMLIDLSKNDFPALAYVFLRLRKKKKNAGQADVSMVKGHERISYYELEQATKGFSESNLLEINIMIDVASAMDYLHNGYSTPVVHCDMKPSNVLLDQDMVGHVTEIVSQWIIAKMQCMLSIMELALSCTLVARTSIEEALCSLEKIRSSFVTSQH
uniref:LRR receptor-like serine/threonine-protein kinase FLS2 n=1 Tax=Nicotiana tabacum TaxID=4097 RepID=A0A1S4AVJ3_TOBAC|nr:PREDICTED: LRR receptor-like serine/threonine-protein kinase FLS2 [Nicotiana tabacum]